MNISAKRDSSTLNLFLSGTRLDQNTYNGELKGVFEGQEYSYGSICQLEFVDVKNLPELLDALKSANVEIRR